MEEMQNKIVGGFFPPQTEWLLSMTVNASEDREKEENIDTVGGNVS